MKTAPPTECLIFQGKLILIFFAGIHYPELEKRRAFLMPGGVRTRNDAKKKSRAFPRPQGGNPVESGEKRLGRRDSLLPEVETERRPANFTRASPGPLEKNESRRIGRRAVWDQLVRAIM